MLLIYKDRKACLGGIPRLGSCYRTFAPVLLLRYFPEVNSSPKVKVAAGKWAKSFHDDVRSTDGLPIVCLHSIYHCAPVQNRCSEDITRQRQAHFSTKNSTPRRLTSDIRRLPSRACESSTNGAELWKARRRRWSLLGKFVSTSFFPGWTLMRTPPRLAKGAKGVHSSSSFSVAIFPLFFLYCDLLVHWTINSRRYDLSGPVDRTLFRTLEQATTQCMPWRFTSFQRLDVSIPCSPFSDRESFHSGCCKPWPSL